MGSCRCTTVRGLRTGKTTCPKCLGDIRIMRKFTPIGLHKMGSLSEKTLRWDEESVAYPACLQLLQLPLPKPAKLSLAVAATVATNGAPPSCGDDETHGQFRRRSSPFLRWGETRDRMAGGGTPVSSVDNIGNFHVGNSLVDLLHGAPFRGRQILAWRLHVGMDEWNH